MFLLIKNILNFFYTLLHSFFFIIEKLKVMIHYKKVMKMKKQNVISNINYIYYWNRNNFVLDIKKYKINFLQKNNLTNSVPLNNVTYLNLLFYIKFFKNILNSLRLTLNKSFSFGFHYIKGFAFILFIDACLTDDEPLWEPIEWSLIQTWILFIFTFAWIAENLIVSRYGSYTGRDKRVWISWYKTFWLIEGYYVVNYGIVCIFVMVPYYFETNYNLSFIYSWWHWYSRTFFFKFISLYSIILLSTFLLQLNIKWLNWKKGLIIILFTNIFIAYLIYVHFIILFFGYFTDPVWYQKSRPVDYIQLSHEPSKWGWGPAKKDHFTYHNVKTVFWFKNDGPFASSFLFFHLFIFLCLFLLFFFWLSLLRRVWSTKELPITFTTYCVSSLRQFFYFFLFLYIFIFISFIINYARLPWEFFYFIDSSSWIHNLYFILRDYVSFLLKLLY